MLYDANIEAKLYVLNTYIDAIKKEGGQQLLLWTIDEDINSIARNAILNKLKESVIEYKFTIDGVIISKLKHL